MPAAAGARRPCYGRPVTGVSSAAGEIVAYLGLGSNLGDRAAMLRAAVAALGATPGVRVEAESAIYATAPVGVGAQPEFLNAALRVRTSLAARALLDACLRVERALGRVRSDDGSKLPRTIDVDLLLYGDARIAEPGLRVPHPELSRRGFALVPLADVALPGLRHPVTGEALDVAAPAPGVARRSAVR